MRPECWSALAEPSKFACTPLTLLKEGQYDQVITSSTTVIEADPNLVKPYEFRARAYIEKGESGLAIADC